VPSSKLDAQDFVAPPDDFATPPVVGKRKRQFELIGDRRLHLDDELCTMSGYIVNVALGGRRAVSQDQCRKITGPSDFALKRFEAPWHGSNLRVDD
jgi:hypothetical protein